ncbi:SRPBCC family protein [Hyphococcus flavus]|uniref:SRPBCC family protein n=1 Tax=Hyphococcus flavus TaxID=1866326 RepID=A0AAF0CBC5_9PROT|nr:SRPBCC family protein [Hyphococcus flavus]WDI30625.1 SRPBCC family protein [Hyphococcus flavus]
MPVQISVTEIVNSPASDVFNAAISFDARKLVQKHGPLPGIVKVDGHDAPWSAIGDVRHHTLSDNSSVREELVTFTPHDTFAYRLTEFTGPFAPLVKGARADWHFTQLGSAKTKIDWTYSFTPRSMAAEGILWFIVKLFWPGYLKAALARVKDEAESSEN